MITHINNGEWVIRVQYPKNFSSSRNKTILQYCAWKKVLHIWATDEPYTEWKLKWRYWPLLYAQIDEVCSYQLGIDIDKKWIDILNNQNYKNSKMIYFDMNHLNELDYHPEVIIFGETIEHLMNLETALSNLKTIMHKDTILIISTPNCHYIWFFLNSILWFEGLHEDHKVFFSFWYLYNLLRFNKISIIEWYFTKLDRYHDTSSLNIFWKISYVFMKVFQRIFRYSTETLLVICKKV